MYVTTEKNGIINPDNYPRLDVHPDADTYVLCAFTERDPNQSDPKQRITIAVYNKKEDADYALIHLYRSLDMGEKTWDSKNVPLFSNMWNEVIQKLSNDQNVSESFLIKSASLNITLPDQLTVTIPYARPDEHINHKNPKEIGDKETDFIQSESKKVSDELITVLQQNPISPIRNLTFTFKVLPKQPNHRSDRSNSDTG